MSRRSRTKQLFLLSTLAAIPSLNAQGDIDVVSTGDTGHYEEEVSVDAVEANEVHDDLTLNPAAHHDLTLNPAAHHVHQGPLPASLAKATLVGAQLRNQADETDTKGDELPSPNTTATVTHNTNAEDITRPKPPITGCVWGSPGCNKKWNAAGASGSINSSSVDAQQAQEENDDEDTPSSSSFAGSATAKIKAHVKEARVSSSSTTKRRTSLSSMRKTNSSGINNIEGESTESNKEPHKPSQGFQLTARIVTSPSDGLSYFLNPSDDALEIDNWTMSIPYTYVECGPTVESTTEAFRTQDMVVRHFPAGAAMGHWVNLSGGVTIDKSIKSKTESGASGESWDSHHDGHPKLLVALSPIEITVSGNNEESRVFYPGEVVLMEDTIGKGHKMRAARGEEVNSKHEDLKVLMVSLPHTVSLSGKDYSRPPGSSKPASTNKVNEMPSENPSSYGGAKHSLFGLVPKQRSSSRFKDYRSSLTTDDTKPCPLEYNSAYSSLFTPSHHHTHRRRRRRRNYQRGESAFSSEYPPPPGHSTYDDESLLFRLIPSLRRTMLFGIGLSLTSSFVYCVQLLYPPLLALIGGATFVMGGALINVLGTRWSYRQWLAVWEEEWRWRREMKRHREAEKDNESKSSQVNDDDGADGKVEETNEFNSSSDDFKEDTTTLEEE
jgi:hypothetical protein